jgi:hypothetical protein
MKFEVVNGETEHITLSGRRVRNPTVLIRVGGISFSKQALLLGIALTLCQVFDGILTFFGLYLLGVEMEGNSFLRMLITAYGAAPILVGIKMGAIALVVILTAHAHRRRWVRPLILMMVTIYVVLAVVPWVYIISDHVAHHGSAAAVTTP